MFVKIVLMVCPSSATEAALHVEDFSVLQHHEDASGNLCRNGSDRLHAEAGTVEVAVVHPLCFRVVAHNESGQLRQSPTEVGITILGVAQPLGLSV